MIFFFFSGHLTFADDEDPSEQVLTFGLLLIFDIRERGERGRKKGEGIRRKQGTWGRGR